MGNRSNINLVGNTTQGQNVGTGDGVYKGKSVGNILQYKSLSVTGTTMVITTDADNIYFSANTGGGGGGIGYSCTSNNSTAAGCGALPYCVDGVSNSAFGNCALCSNTTGDNNVAVGHRALRSNSTGLCNTAVGTNVLYDNTGSNNTAMGHGALCCNLTGSANIAIGTLAMIWNRTGSNNVAVGHNSIRLNCSGSTNVGIGHSVMYCNCGGCNNVAVGSSALYLNLFGCKNVAIGTGAGLNETASDKLHIANCGDCSLIEGDFIGKTVTIDNKLITTNFQMTNGAAAGCFLCSDASGNGVWVTGGGGGGLSASSNGLNDNGTTVKLGGALSETTTISGASYTHDMCFHQLNAMYVNAADNVTLCGCDSNCLVVGLGIQLYQGTSSFTQMKNLCPKTSETDVLYINAGGCLFTGATSGGASYWDRVGTCVIPATADDDIRLDCNAYLTWSGTTTCITAFNSSGTPGADYFCIKRGGTTCISSGPTDQVTVYTQGNLSVRSSSASVGIYPTGSIITQCVHQNMCFLGGPSADGTKAGDACICGGQSSSTGNGGNVYLKGGTSVGGADGIICIVGATTATNDITATDFVLSSDESLKTNICSYSPTQLDVNYVQYEFCNKPGCPRYGVIAQELETSLPELVRCSSDGMLSVSYIDLLVREVAYLKHKVEELEKKIG